MFKQTHTSRIRTAWYCQFQFASVCSIIHKYTTGVRELTYHAHSKQCEIESDNLNA